MADDAVFPPADESLSPNSGIIITMDEDSENSEELPDENGEHEYKIDTNDLGNEESQIVEVKSNDLENAIEQVLEIERVDHENNNEQVLGIDGVDLDLDNEGEHVLEFESKGEQMHANLTDAVMDGQTDDTHEKSHAPPVEGMEFESYDDAYNYYNNYAKDLGFGIRVKSSWTKRNSKEKRGAVLSCNCEGFKTTKEASSTRRKETRTGCLAMIRLRLVESNRWRLDEVKLDHNHLFDHQRAQNSRSHKKMEAGSKRKLESAIGVEVQTIKLYRTPIVDTLSYGNSNERELGSIEPLKRLKLKNGDVQALYNYFSQAQLADPNFFYIMDLNDEGYLRNVFWIDSRSRAAYGNFSDVVLVDTTCLTNKHETPLLSFSGLNHHGKSMLFGCGLLVDETMETYIWLMRAWLTCMSGRPPQTIITDQCTALWGAISEVFPRAHHRLCLPLVMKTLHEKLGEIGESEIFQTVLNRTVYNSMKIEEFEKGWEEMTQHFGIGGHEWLKSLYEDRERWVPVYAKDSGVFTSQPGEFLNPFFYGYLQNETTVSEFFSIYDILQQKNIQSEGIDDSESREFSPVLKTICSYELQLSEIYTKEIFLKFQEEVVLMSNCVGVTQIQANGPIATYMVKEQDPEGDKRESKFFEVVYDKVGIEIRCICNCFNFRGYLCRHALTVLNYNGVEEIPNHYILTRWRKDIKRLYAPDLGSYNIDISNPVQWFDHLYRRAMQVVSEGMKSQDHQMVAWQAFKESLNKIGDESRHYGASCAGMENPGVARQLVLEEDERSRYQRPKACGEDEQVAPELQGF
ncbi:hypothetical protein BUALT_Bualt07G0126800 [Buddleja alternifolia]|uniref:Protein FAR1-RELATED SEQUENCE n=1 Tax=Buddleja alternifolia TaxID=168488 RepID=A0AAV6XBK3_9LAMI|nr:hypothetical protein BUALT_Bualt07G0126800 [Buddleja alternifolia]